MRFSSPWNLLFLFFIPLVILMYILKQKFEERIVPSVYLWEQVLKDIEVNTPWQKLKKNILLFLQVFALLLLVFSLANPSIFIRGGREQNLIVVIDNTGSMSALYDDDSRLEAAKKRAEGYINSISPSRITVISCGTHPNVEINTEDRNEAISRIRGIKPSFSKGDTSEVIPLIKAISKQDMNTRTVIFTDSPIDIKDVNAELVSLASICENVSLDYISSSYQGGQLRTLVRATNRGENSLSSEISLYGDGRLLGLTQVDIGGGETKTAYFNEIPSDISYLSAELTEKDDLLEDNIVYEVVRQSEKKKALLVTDKNIFIEKALSTMGSLELFKAGSMDSTTDKFDLYIFDGSVPDAIPEGGSIMLIDPPEENGIVKTLGDTEGGASSVLKHPVTRYIENAHFTVSAMKSIETPYWADVIIRAGDKPAALAGEYDGRRICIINFDMHNSDFPLTPEFPIFLYNTISYLVESDFDSKTSYLCGESVDINTLPDAESASISLPSGSMEKADLKYPALPFEHTYEIGIYTLSQKAEDREIRSIFAVNFPSNDESDVNKSLSSMSQGVEEGAFVYGKNIQLLLMILLLGAVAIEWVVYTRGY